MLNIRRHYIYLYIYDRGSKEYYEKNCLRESTPVDSLVYIPIIIIWNVTHTRSACQFCFEGDLLTNTSHKLTTLYSSFRIYTLFRCTGVREIIMTVCRDHGGMMILPSLYSIIYTEYYIVGIYVINRMIDGL